MATVSQICEEIAAVVPMPVEDVQKYARALINSGDLPKAVGRSIPQTTMQDRAKLILAIAASERPSLCVKAMRDRYEAPSRFGAFDATAGEVLADQLREIATESFEAFQKWSYSDIEVSRSGNPRVKFRINENVRHFDGFQNGEQPEFIGGSYAAKSVEEMAEKAKEFGHTGLPVSAFIPGSVLIVLAFGSRADAFTATVRAAKEGQRRAAEDRELQMEEAKADGKMAVFGTAADIRRALAESEKDGDE